MSTAQTLEVPGYQVVQYLGSGARSTIWHVRDCQTNDSFALKRTVKHESSDDKFLQQIQKRNEKQDRPYLNPEIIQLALQYLHYLGVKPEEWTSLSFERVWSAIDDAYNNRGCLLVEEGDFERAIADFTHVIGIEPNNATAYYNRGSAWRGLKEYRKAIEDFKKSIALDPSKKDRAETEIKYCESRIKDLW